MLKELEVFELLYVFTKSLSSFAAPDCVFCTSMKSFVLLCVFAESMVRKTEIKKILMVRRKKWVGQKNKNEHVRGVKYRIIF